MNYKILLFSILCLQFLIYYLTSKTRFCILDNKIMFKVISMFDQLLLDALNYCFQYYYCNTINYLDILIVYAFIFYINNFT